MGATDGRAAGRQLTAAAGGLAVAVALVVVVAIARSRFWIIDPDLGTLLGFLAVWVPLTAAVVVASAGGGSRPLRAVASDRGSSSRRSATPPEGQPIERSGVGSGTAPKSEFDDGSRSGSDIPPERRLDNGSRIVPSERFGDRTGIRSTIGRVTAAAIGLTSLRFRPIDLIWGLSIGLLARVVATLLETLVYGSPATPPARFAADYDAWWVFAVILAPVVIGPVVEEVFFRGLVLRATLARFGSPVIAVVLSALLFSFAHLVLPPLGVGTLAIGLSTLVFGLAAATLAVLTGRAGGAIVAHIAFNGFAVVPGLL